MKRNMFQITLLLILIFKLNNINAWVYPEHRQIALLAIQKLNPKYRSKLDSLWAEARKGYENRLTETVIDANQTINPTLLDYAAWPAIAGDHSCSAENMLHTVLETEWILKVAHINAQLKIDLANSEERDEHINSLRNSDILLQASDPEYATRAGSNNVHFLLPLSDVYIEMDTYLHKCTKEGAELNAFGAYTLFHFSALRKLTMLVAERLTSKERSALILAALADEAFALHFLEDIFAAGHVAGTWGNASQRKGTHDYYNEYGIKSSTWHGENMILTGDSWMRKEDSERAASIIRLSIEQFLDAANGEKHAMFYNNEEKTLTADNFNVCNNYFIPDREMDPKLDSLLYSVLIKTPIPGLVNGLGELPRFRAEVGLFLGFTPSLRGNVLLRGFGENQNTVGLNGGIEAAARFGIGLDGVLNEAGDGLVFLGLGWRQDGSSTTGVINEPDIENYGSLLAAIPGRSAFQAHLRLPFYLIPGDLLIAGPLLFLISPDALTKMAVKAANGGLIPWQSGIATPFGRIQFVLGREVGVYFFGRTRERDALFNISKNPSGNEDLYILSYRSTQIEFPIIEYRPFRSFSTDQSSTLLFQIYGGLDIPHNVEVLDAVLEIPLNPPDLENIWYFGVRMIFDWRHYF